MLVFLPHTRSFLSILVSWSAYFTWHFLAHANDCISVKWLSLRLRTCLHVRELGSNSVVAEKVSRATASVFMVAEPPGGINKHTPARKVEWPLW